MYTEKKILGFAGLQIRNGLYGAISSNNSSEGVVIFCCDKNMPIQDFFEAIYWVDSNSERILELALESFVDQYWEMRDLVHLVIHNSRLPR